MPRLLGLLVAGLTTACGVPTGGLVQEVAVPTVHAPPAEPDTMGGRREITVYFVPGTRLEAVSRQVAERRPQTSVELLLAGPTRAEVVSGLRTALSPQDLAVLPGPDGAGTATISAGPEFAGIDGSNQLLAVAQVVWTVTQFPQIDRVCFRVDGAFVEVPTDTGLSDESVSRADYRSVAPRSARDGTGTRDRPAGTQAVPADRSPGPTPGGRQAHPQ